ncbi:sodium:solute symporter [Allokutzneria sp. A3M-2-11 16]|uniref:sodium:solute symporter n=1 Tax=Allokutzneria sp. A3M-2-11 16 TaxID=2962043 RepID=UPI0020B6F47D|nr:sodium:solute symporter [Allokutzneria sp. A3M-2-11 16]MCP3798013.1 sodium:solute symporter [Allokutzneria sp. A3M-2-11 16]
MHALDLIIVAAFLIGMPLLGVLFGGRQRSSKDYFVSDKPMSWWVVCLSVVSAETSALTVISVPTVAYLGTFTFLQLAIGYLLGRIVVAFVLLPKYMSGNLVTAYAYLGKRFGSKLQSTASVTFLFTRLLADGLRLFATAIPIKVLLAAYDIHAPYWAICLVTGIGMLVFSYIGGVRAVVWVDAVQLGVYIIGGLAVIAVLAGKLPEGWLGQAFEAGKFQIFDTGADILTSPYAIVTAVLGGAVLSMASHGSDQLIVQRLMSCKNLKDSRRALIGSGVIVFFQFGLFLFIGVMIWALFKGATPASMGMAASDELFPHVIINVLPPGVSGFMLASILAAAMSSSLNALASSTVTDVIQKVSKRTFTDAEILRQGKIWTVVWAGLLIGFASMFTSKNNPIVEQGLSITGYTYGALLGAFLLGLIFKKARQTDALVAFVVTVLGMATIILTVKFPVGAKELALAYPWYPPLGVLITLVVGGLLSLRHSTNAPEAVEAELPVK